MAVIYDADSTKWISIAGNIGSGKSTLSELVGSELYGQVGGKLIPYNLLTEEWKTNPYFNRYYEAITHFYDELGNGSFTNGSGSGKQIDPIFFNAQYWWLTKKGNQNSEIPDLLKTINVSQDRSIYEDGLFAKNFIRMGLISKRDAEVYLPAYEGLSYYPLPDMIFYLKTSPEICMERIIKRGRAAERKIPLKYLQALDGMYEEWWNWFLHPNKKEIDTDKLNLVDSQNDIMHVMDIIRASLAKGESKPESPISK
jgi:deoxyadenosine/deoxycytidine kinase